MVIKKLIASVVMLTLLGACSKTDPHAPVQINQVMSEIPDSLLYCVQDPEKYDVKAVPGSIALAEPRHTRLYYNADQKTLKVESVPAGVDTRHNKSSTEQIRISYFKVSNIKPGDFKLVRDDTGPFENREVNSKSPLYRLRNLTLESRVNHGEFSNYTNFTVMFDWTDPEGEKFFAKMNCHSPHYSTPEESKESGERIKARIQARNQEDSEFKEIISRVRSRGGNCPTLAGHLTAHLQRNDMNSFYETLEVGKQYGCGD
jgi:hypothetical protein